MTLTRLGSGCGPESLSSIVDHRAPLSDVVLVARPVPTTLSSTLFSTWLASVSGVTPSAVQIVSSSASQTVAYLRCSSAANATTLRSAVNGRSLGGENTHPLSIEPCAVAAIPLGF